ncbi:hypothetical protein [Streptomyces sp. URMC 123]|uniref:hypothetical protein n=1 Tax=Streptomyces sp. URMC 123 TaxID=3423403 RepID=UPI003F1A8173
MSEVEELRRRMDAMEAEIATLREDAATTRALVAINDRDVAEFRSELRAHRQVLSALRETQIEQGQRLDSLDGEVRRGFSTVLSAVEAIARRLDRGGPPRGEDAR